MLMAKISHWLTVTIFWLSIPLIYLNSNCRSNYCNIDVTFLGVNIYLKNISAASEMGDSEENEEDQTADNIGVSNCCDKCEVSSWLIRVTYIGSQMMAS